MNKVFQGKSYRLIGKYFNEQKANQRADELKDNSCSRRFNPIVERVATSILHASKWKLPVRWWVWIPEDIK